MNVISFFKVFRRDFSNFIENMDDIKKLHYLAHKLSMVDIQSKKYPPFYFYRLLKNRRDLFTNEIGFKCINCSNSCCYFSKNKYSIIRGVFLYREDINRFKKYNINLEGIVPIKQNINVNIESLCGVSRDRLVENLNILGIEYGLRLIDKDEKLQCYFYNDKENKCKIHKYKPLTCYIHPFVMNFSGTEIIYAEECPLISNLSLKERYKLGLKLSLMEYRFSILIYSLYIRRISIKKKPDGKIFLVNFPPELGLVLGELDEQRKKRLSIE